MREIKFKCVLSEYKETEKEDVEIKVIGDVLNIDFHTNSIQVMFSDGNCEWYELDSIKLLEYTGLKDINGVEIYEGDIIKRLDSETNFIIVFNKGCFCTQDSENLHHNLGLLESINSFSKVVGNIYENPELLEVK